MKPQRTRNDGDCLAKAATKVSDSTGELSARVLQMKRKSSEDYNEESARRKHGENLKDRFEGSGGTR